MGVGVTVAVAVGVNVAVAVGVNVAVAVGVNVAVAVGVGEAVGVGVGTSQSAQAEPSYRALGMLSKKKVLYSPGRLGLAVGVAEGVAVGVGAGLKVMTAVPAPNSLGTRMPPSNPVKSVGGYW